MINFTIGVSSHGKTRKFKVYVYETLTDMYKATNRWSMLRDGTKVKENYHAITHSYNNIDINPDGTEVNYPNVGIIRLCKDYLHSYVIAHEIAHATLNVYQLDCVEETDNVYDHIDPGNETFCHILSELEHNIVSKLHRHGAYSSPKAPKGTADGDK